MGSYQKDVKIWDLPTRLFHWALVLAIFICWYSMEVRQLSLHKYSGLFVLFLLVFRFLWGLVGSETARFKHFITTPWAALNYLKKSFSNNSNTHAGHNPAGGWMVMLMLFVIFLQVLMGMFANDDIGFNGPFADLVLKEQSDLATKIHVWLFNVILALIWLHLVAVFFYVLVKMQNIVKAMLTGSKPLSQAGGCESFYFASLKRVLAVYSISLFVPTVILFTTSG